MKAPGLRAARPVPERFEWDGELGAPAFFGPRRLDVPHGIPVPVEVPFVAHFLIAERAKRIGLKEHAAAAIVEGIDDDLDVVVLKDVVAVPAHFVGDDAIRLVVQTAHREVNVRGVKENPELGSLGRRLSLVRLLLDEIADRGDLTVNLILQTTIEDKWLCEADRAYGHAPRSVARHDLRTGEGGRTVSRRRILSKRG